jgi:hypothetical protein
MVRYVHIHLYTYTKRVRLSIGAWLGVMARLVAHTRIHMYMPALIRIKRWVRGWPWI